MRNEGMDVRRWPTIVLKSHVAYLVRTMQLISLTPLLMTLTLLEHGVNFFPIKRHNSHQILRHFYRFPVSC